MNGYVLDTDTTTLLLRGHTKVCRRVAQMEPELLAVTIVTVEEILTGWYSQIRRARKDEQLIRAYAALQEAVQFLGRLRILPLDADALRQLHDLRAAKHRLGSNDLKIAAIVRAQGSILVTRNTRDFKRIPSMRLEDWT
jgi:tRNA(fMet)-specific endonuclease VapC